MVSIVKSLVCILVSVFILPAILLGCAVFQYVKVVTPPGVDQPLKLRFCCIVLFSAMTLGFIFEKLGLQSLLGILRILLDGVPPLKDPSLLIENKHFDEIPVRIYRSKKPGIQKRKAVLYFHGGAGTVGSIDAFERICRYIAKETDSMVVSVGYHVGPENPYPNQYTECFKATVHLMKNSEAYQVDSSRIILSGDSFGATLATRVCQLLVNRRDLPKVHAQVLIYPALQGIDFSLPSYQQNCSIPILWPEIIMYFGCRYLRADLSVMKDLLKHCHVPEEIRLKYRKWVSADLIPERFKVRGYKPENVALRQFKPKVYEKVKQIFEVSFSPLLAEDSVICKLPQTYIVTCEFDTIRDDGLLYKKRLEDQGVPVTWLHIEGGTHGIASLFGYGFFSFPSSKRIVRETTTFIKNI